MYIGDRIGGITIWNMYILMSYLQWLQNKDFAAIESD